MKNSAYTCNKLRKLHNLPTDHISADPCVIDHWAECERALGSPAAYYTLGYRPNAAWLRGGSLPRMDCVTTFSRMPATGIGQLPLLCVQTRCQWMRRSRSPTVVWGRDPLAHSLARQLHRGMAAPTLGLGDDTASGAFNGTRLWRAGTWSLVGPTTGKPSTAGRNRTDADGACTPCRYHR